MASADDGTDTGFSCLATFRYVVAATGTVIVIVVVIMAVSVVLRPGDLHLSVDHGSATVSELPRLSSNGSCRVILRAYNPSGRAGIYYNNNTVRLLYNSSEIASFNFDPFFLPVQSTEIITTVATLHVESPDAAELISTLYHGYNAQVTVEVHAFVNSKIGPVNDTGHNVAFNCWPVLIGYYPLWSSNTYCTISRTG